MAIKPHSLKSRVPASDGSDKLLRAEAYEELKRRILQGETPPGSFLSERGLVRDLGMSKTPIRMALERLEAEGLVRISPSQGIVVSVQTMYELVDVMDMRDVIEGHIVRNLAGRLTDSEQRQLQAHLAAQHEAAEKQDVDRGIELDVEFHLMLADFVGNQELNRIMRQLQDKTTRAVIQVLRYNSLRLPYSVAEHHGIAEAIIAGDSEEAVARMHRHLEYGRSFLVTRGKSERSVTRHPLPG